MDENSSFVQYFLEPKEAFRSFRAEGGESEQLVIDFKHLALVLEPPEVFNYLSSVRGLMCSIYNKTLTTAGYQNIPEKKSSGLKIRSNILLYL